jgi:hypothetical protein
MIIDLTLIMITEVPSNKYYEHLYPHKCNTQKTFA